MSQRSFKLAGRWNQVLVRLAAFEPQASSPQQELTAKELREKENSLALGGLRNPRHAVMKSPKLRAVGERIRCVVSPLVSDELASTLNEEITAGVSRDWVLDVRHALCREFGVVSSDKGLQPDLWQAMLRDADDPDADCLPDWLRHGFPLGIKCKILNTGVFPSTTTVSTAIEESRLHGHLMSDENGQANNYVSFDESVEHAQRLLDELVDAGRAEVFDSWDAVVQAVGSEAKLTKLACIVKVRDSGETKYRLVVDSRRSGVNGLMDVKERVILPKITDVATSIQRLLCRNRDYERQELELVSVDFKDAFHMCPLRQDERQFVVWKDSYGCYHVSKVVQFGLSPGPLLWARLAAASMRLAQSVVRDWESCVATYWWPLADNHGKLPNRKVQDFVALCSCVAGVGLGIVLEKGRSWELGTLDWVWA